MAPGAAISLPSTLDLPLARDQGPSAVAFPADLPCLNLEANALLRLLRYFFRPLLKYEAERYG